MPPIEGETEDGAYKYRMGELDLSGFYVDKNDVKLELCRVQVRAVGRAVRRAVRRAVPRASASVSLCVSFSLVCVWLSGPLSLGFGLSRIPSLPFLFCVWHPLTREACGAAGVWPDRNALS